MVGQKIFTLVGGISQNSLNKKLFHAVEENLPHGFEITSYDIQKLPFFSQDLENDPPDSVVSFKDLIRNADGVLFITPEYNRSFPGVLKNAIDWGSRPFGQNLWDKKPSAVMGASPGSIGTFGAQHHLRQVLAYLNMHVMGQPEFYLNATKTLDKEGNFIDTKSRDFLSKFLDAFVQLLKEHQIMKNGSLHQAQSDLDLDQQHTQY